MAKIKLKQKDIEKIENFYYKKIIEFNKLTLDELKLFYNKGRLSSTESRALLDVVSNKLQKIKEETIEEKIKEIKAEDEIKDE